MGYIIVTNNIKVFNFYKKTDKIIFLKNQNIEDVLNFTEKKCLEGYRILSDPIAANLENPNNPYKSLLITEHQTEDNDNSIKMIIGILDIIKKVPLAAVNDYEDDDLDEFKSIDLQLIKSGIVRLNKIR